MNDVLDHLLHSTTPPAPIPTLAAWLAQLDACPFEPTIDRALWAGFEADRLGYAFAGGYTSALAALVHGKAGRTSLAATESGGGHPRAIGTTLVEGKEGLRLRGTKTFVTLASVADAMLVVASRGQDSEGRNRLCLVRVSTSARGVTIEDRPPTPFAPEIPHARVTFDDVAVGPEDLLPGDGYDRYLKPFRTIEDTHVLAAALGHVLRVARAYAFDPAVPAGAFAQVLALRAVSTMDPTDPRGHVALAGVFGATRKIVADHDGEWDRLEPEVRDRWRRDLGLLMVAETVRQKRTEAAWKALANG